MSGGSKLLDQITSALHWSNHRMAGRPTSYSADYVGQAEKLCALGATDSDVADFFEVSVRTIYRWQSEHPKFCQALKAGKGPADERVERSLYHKAVGYTYDAIKIFPPKGDGEVVTHAYQEHVPPDTTAAIFWLKNRRPDAWRDVSRQEVSGPDGQPLHDPRSLAKAVVALLSTAVEE